MIFSLLPRVAEEILVKAQGPGAGRVYLPVSEVGNEAIIIFVD